MKLHIFNPEHDLALAFGGKFFTAPHAGRQLRPDLGFLPAIWAEDGDFVWVDDVDNALHQLRMSRSHAANVNFVTQRELRHVPKEGLQIQPWGWDAAIRHQLKKEGFTEPLLPLEGRLSRIRLISNRRWAASRLGNTGVYCRTMEAVREQMNIIKEQAGSDRACFVLKAPWSSSGRGIRYVQHMTPQVETWAQRILRMQSGLMVEPYYNKVRDFGMEFESHADGSVSYVGLSLFETINGAYQGNLLASESEKMKILAGYGLEGKLREARKKIIGAMSAALRNIYVGPFGVDMMITTDADGKYMLLPCVELNLRRTMGHVAIALTRRINPDGMLPHQHMRIEYDGSHYHFRILNTNTNALNTSLIY